MGKSSGHTAECYRVKHGSNSLCGRNGGGVGGGFGKVSQRWVLLRSFRLVKKVAQGSQQGAWPSQRPWG